MERLNNLKKEMTEHLTQKIIPFWKKMRDDVHGGYYGYMDFDGNIDRSYVKGCILNSRILWFFSNAYLLLRDESLLDEAKHAYGFMKSFCMDREYGGIYWSVNYDGTVCEDIKHTYNQAFAIYALASYYDATRDINVLNDAIKIYNLIEQRCMDKYGYMESFKRDFSPEDNDKLSENGVIADKTMNTVLHVFEAYSELYRVTHSERIAKSMNAILSMIAYKIYNPKLKRQEVFFDAKWNSLIDLHSYGHDIEASWLIDLGCNLLPDKERLGRIRDITDALADTIYNRAYVNHSVLNECENGVDNENRIWWVQAESVVGLFNAWQKHNERTEYLDAALDIWDYIKRYIVDGRDFSEWFWELDKNNTPISGRPIAEPWKCPYHNGRMCIEIIKRVSAL